SPLLYRRRHVILLSIQRFFSGGHFSSFLDHPDSFSLSPESMGGEMIGLAELKGSRQWKEG
ncbi:hypothetical protein LINGRAHAP2_LOCUS36761, partial [Linum grandiflorum]